MLYTPTKKVHGPHYIIMQNVLPGKLNSGFPRRLENLENENGHGKVMEHEKLAKSHGI